MDNRIRVMKHIVSKELWIKVRVASLNSGKVLAQWITEALQEKLDKEKSKNG